MTIRALRLSTLSFFVAERYGRHPGLLSAALISRHVPQWVDCLS